MIDCVQFIDSVTVIERFAGEEADEADCGAGAEDTRRLLAIYRAEVEISRARCMFDLSSR